MEKTKVYITTQRAIPLGYQGEGEVREIIFRPPVELLEENWTLMHQRQDDDEPYPVPLTVTSDSLTWTVTSGDTAQSGTGLTQLICMDAAGSVLKSMIYQTSVARSMDVTGDVPDPVEPWYNSLTEQIGKAGTVKSVNHVEPDESGNVQLDISGGGGSGTAGEDGFSPTATVTQTDDGAVITITDKSGITTATVTNGKDGAQGPKGDTGATGAQGPKGDTGAAGATGPKGDKGDTGATGAQGPKGDTGATGAQGPKGDTGATGPAGADGKTPVKGTDYWTESDKEEIVEEVVERVGSTGGSGTVGEDGYSPTATVTQTDDGAVITITDKSGTTTATVTNGKDGAQGPKGDTGAAGATGPKGDKGDTGATGPQGPKGDTGATGAQGPKGDTGATGATGPAGANGKDGTSITITDITMSAVDGGSNTVTFSNGKTLSVLNGTKGSTGAAGAQGPKGDTGAAGAQGPKGDTGATGAQGPKGDTGATGPAGADGKTPVKGTDYWTEADQESVVQQVITALGTPVFGTVDSNNVITLSGALAEKFYTIRYEDANGNYTIIGTLNNGPVVYTNQLAIATDENGDIWNGTGYADGYRLNSYSGVNTGSNNALTSTDGYFVTGFIPYTLEQAESQIPFYIKGITLDLTNLSEYLRASLTVPGSTDWFGVAKLIDMTDISLMTITQLGENYYKFTPNKNLYTTNGWNKKSTTHIRFSMPGSGAGVIITVNEQLE